MVSFCAGKVAHKSFPDVVKIMNAAEKIVFSKSLGESNWAHTRIVSVNIFEEIYTLKKGAVKDLTLLGSANVLTQLVDEYKIMIDPVAPCQGNPFLDILSISCV